MMKTHRPFSLTGVPGAIKTLVSGSVLSLVLLGNAFAGNPAPKNPHLADSTNPIGHTSSAQQDSVPQAGPIGPTKVLSQSELEYRHVGPFQFGTSISGVYPDGQRVLWSNGSNGVFKSDHETFDVIYRYPLESKFFTEEEAEESLTELREREGLSAIYFAFKQSGMFEELSGVYTVLDNNHDYYIGDKGGTGITVYGDKDPSLSTSPIIKKRQWKVPAEVTGKMIGMNMTFDGWVVVATEHGYIVAVKKDFSESRFVRLNFAIEENAEDAATGSIGKGWVRNGFAIDETGIYVASQNHMHKVVWNNEQLSVNTRDGAWTVQYGNEVGQGTGSTPSLMGFGDEDKLVVITDGNRKMSLMTLWRDEPPEGWKQIDGATSPQVAGMALVDMGNPELDVQSEQSVVVSGYGAAVVNNVGPRPWYVPEQASPILSGFLGSREDYLPVGIQKFEWNDKTKKLETVWVNTTVSSPNAMPMVSAGSDTFYTTGVRDGNWTLEGINWSTGESRFHYVLGDEKYNTLFSGVLMDEKGRLYFGTTFGKVRLNPKDVIIQASAK